MSGLCQQREAGHPPISLQNNSLFISGMNCLNLNRTQAPGCRKASEIGLFLTLEPRQHRKAREEPEMDAVNQAAVSTRDRRLLLCCHGLCQEGGFRKRSPICIASPPFLLWAGCNILPASLPAVWQLWIWDLTLCVALLCDGYANTGDLNMPGNQSSIPLSMVRTTGLLGWCVLPMCLRQEAIL